MEKNDTIEIQFKSPFKNMEIPNWIAWILLGCPITLKTFDKTIDDCFKHMLNNIEDFKYNFQYYDGFKAKSEKLNIKIEGCWNDYRPSSYLIEGEYKSNSLKFKWVNRRPSLYVIWKIKQLKNSIKKKEKRGFLTYTNLT